MAADKVTFDRPSGTPGTAFKAPVGIVLAVALGLFSGLQPAGAASTSEITAARAMFTPHRALYDMELRSAAQGSDVSDASGTMFYRFQPLCDGWEVESRVAMRLHYGMMGEAEVVETTWVFTSFESYDGTRLTYAVEHNKNGQLQEAFAGEADKTLSGGEATFGTHETDGVGLPAQTLYPAEHLIRLLAHARGGDGPFKQTVFDGASVDNPYEVNAIVLGPVEDGSLAVAQKPVERGVRNPVLVAGGNDVPEARIWRVRMAYFPVFATASIPDFELEIDYREDGVAKRMVQDFGDFQLDLTPSRIEPLPRPTCE